MLGVLLPLGVTGVTTAWTLGAYELAGFELNAITGLLPPILMVLSLAVSVHLIQGWLDAPAAADDRVARILGVVRRLLFPCFFCSLTTALGFASLVTSSMPAVRQFGVFAALGVMRLVRRRDDAGARRAQLPRAAGERAALAAASPDPPPARRGGQRGLASIPGACSRSSARSPP